MHHDPRPRLKLLMGLPAAIGLFLLSGSTPCVLGDGAASVPGGVLQADPWWNSSWPYRRGIRVKLESQAFREAYIDLPTGGHVLPDGRDIVLVAGGDQPVNSKILSCGFDDSVLLAFEIQRGASQYFAYFGNKRARRTVETWEPEGGLLLEVREMGEGAADTLDGLFDLLNRSPRVQGRDFRSRPALTLNPFGPQKEYISIFQGLLRIPETGEYRFAVNSRDASFALVDGNLVAAWPGRHDADAWDALGHSGALHLGKGLHKLTFYNAAFDHGGCVLGIQAPSWPAVRPLQGSFLLPIAEGEVSGLETVSRTPEADFVWRFDGDLGLEEVDATLMSFRNATSHLEENVLSCRWDFGDGQCAGGMQVEHVFLESGIYTVTMTLHLEKGGTMKASRRLRIRPKGLLRRVGKDRNQRFLSGFIDVIEGYDMKALSPAACATLTTLARYADRDDLELEGLAGQFRGEQALDDPGLVKDALEYGHRLVRDRSDFEEALRIFLRVAREGTDRRDRLAGQLAAAEVSLFYLDAIDAAESLLLSSRINASTIEGRMLLLRLGDVNLARGRVDDARELYGKTAAETLRQGPDEDSALLRGDHLARFRAYLRSGDHAAAEDVLRSWEIRMPSLKGTGEITSAWAELMMERGQWRPAARQLEWTLSLDPEGHRAASVLLDLGRCFERLGEEAKAHSLYRRIIEEHPLSPERRSVEERNF